MRWGHSINTTRPLLAWHCWEGPHTTFSALYSLICLAKIKEEGAGVLAMKPRRQGTKGNLSVLDAVGPCPAPLHAGQRTHPLSVVCDGC